ncbi:MAG: hypothetical protein JO142_05625 [Burkholderiales bacterium]|nr:hypothetical protein [Burkholderiales bacterium]
MWLGTTTGGSASTLQERVQQHYGRVVQAGNAPQLVTTDNDNTAVAANQTWNDALAKAMEKSNSLIEAQAEMHARETEVARREKLLAEREKALQAERARLTNPLLFAVRKFG